MTREEASDVFFKEFTAILAKHNVNPEDANLLTLDFGARWHFYTEKPLEPMKQLLHGISLSQYLKKEAEITALCLRATEDLHLLIS